MDSARDAALAPFRAAKKATADADRHLQHVSTYIERCGNEDDSEWELGDWVERNHLAAEIKTKLRPKLVQKLLEENMAEARIHKLIEKWIGGELEVDK